MGLPKQTEIADRPASFATSGYTPLILAIACLLAGAWFARGFFFGRLYGEAGLIALAFFLASFVIYAGVYSLEPNQSAVLTLFGAYVGSDHKPGLRFTNPLYRVSKISRRIHNHECKTIKVNDLLGSGSRHRCGRSAHHTSRLCAGNSRRHAAPSTSLGGSGGAAACR
jgi:hypothetical protein